MTERVTKVKTVTASSQENNSQFILVVRENKNGKSDSYYINDEENEEQSGDESDTGQIQEYFYENKDAEVITEPDVIWSHKRSTPNDIEATEHFLQLRTSEKYRQMFDEKKLSRFRVWQAIAQEMNNAGYYVGEGRDGGERCRQKFSNLEKGFLKYVRHVRNGDRIRNTPPFYELLYQIIDPEDKIHKKQLNTAIVPDKLRDSLKRDLIQSSVNTSEPSNDNNDFEPDVQVTNEQRFKKSKDKNEIISLLQKQHAETMKLQREFLEKLDKHLMQQNEQRERLINTFIDAIREPNCSCRHSKKRRRSSSNESS